jgi:hypothetical protein
MPARDRLHTVVRRAPEKEGWLITDDPLKLKVGKRDLYVDLGAERLLAAERGDDKIAVEIKGLSGPSIMAELEQALGQYMLYATALKNTEPERALFLAIPTSRADILAEPIGQLLLKDRQIQVILFDGVNEVITQWLNQL